MSVQALPVYQTLPRENQQPRRTQPLMIPPREPTAAISNLQKPVTPSSSPRSSVPRSPVSPASSHRSRSIVQDTETTPTRRLGRSGSWRDTFMRRGDRAGGQEGLRVHVRVSTVYDTPVGRPRGEVRLGDAEDMSLEGESKEGGTRTPPPAYYGSPTRE